VHSDKTFPAHKADVLDDERRLASLSEAELLELLDLRGDEHVADLGSGTGFYTDRIAARTTGTVFAVEFQPEMQARHRERGVPPNVSLVLSDVDDLPLAAGSIQRALSINAFHEAHGGEGLARVARALTPGGTFVVVDWRRAPDAAARGPRLEHRLTKEEALAILAPWFAPLRAYDLADYFAVVVCRRDDLPADRDPVADDGSELVSP
jgi:ubiquinone/menaquinone biosynthesis C-methylase UbiE